MIGSHLGDYVGFTAGTFDLLHAGHVLMLEECGDVCDYLLVGLQVDPSVDRPEKNKPIQTVLERALQLYGCTFVDQIIVYETEKDLELMLKILPINVRIVGAEYEGKEFTGKKICEERDMHIHYNKRNHDFSSTELRERIREHG